MEQRPVVLASASPRRRRLLEWLGVTYSCETTDAPEDLSSPLRRVPPVLARSIAAGKALAARRTVGADALVLAFDTIVVLDGEVLGKPADEDDAVSMLRSLSARSHEVVTGVAVSLPGGSEAVTFAVTTPVAMRDLSDADIAAWIARGEALGCAGAYNIEHHLASVAPDECFQNVAGLPLCHLYERLVRLGVDDIAAPVTACEQSRGQECALGRRLCGATR